MNKIELMMSGKQKLTSAEENPILTESQMHEDELAILAGYGGEE